MNIKFLILKQKLKNIPISYSGKLLWTVYTKFILQIPIKIKIWQKKIKKLEIILFTRFFPTVD